MTPTREHGPNPYPAGTFLAAHWETRRALRDLARALAATPAGRAFYRIAARLGRRPPRWMR